MSDPFTPEIADAVTRHMNGDHTDDNVVICRALGGQPDATSATMTGLSPAGIDFAVDTPAGPATAHVPWRGPIAERADIRRDVVAMYDEACALLGLPGRDAAEHTEQSHEHTEQGHEHADPATPTGGHHG